MSARDRLIRRAVRERFVVTTLDGSAFDGLLAEADDRTLVLVDAFALDGGQRVRVDGSLFVARDRVNYMQRPTA